MIVFGSHVCSSKPRCGSVTLMVHSLTVGTLAFFHFGFKLCVPLRYKSKQIPSEVISELLWKNLVKTTTCIFVYINVFSGSEWRSSYFRRQVKVA